MTYTLPTSRRFDFNAVGSPTQLPAAPPTVGGYFGVLPTETYTANLGFGWVGAVLPAGGFDRGALTGTNYSRLLRDGVYGGVGAAGAATFRVDLPDGTYQVTVDQGARKRGHRLRQGKLGKGGREIGNLSVKSYG